MTESEPTAGDVFELERIRKLVELMKEFDLRELDLRQSEQQIRLSRGPEAVGLAAAPVYAAAPVPPPTAVPPAAPAAEAGDFAYIKSPMVGTYYSRANPKSEPFVRVGDFVEPDKTVCIIEAMKVFNEIPAEMRGRIVAVLVEDEEAVEFGKPLFKVDRST